MADIAERAWNLGKESMLWQNLASMGTAEGKGLMYKSQDFFADAADDLKLLDIWTRIRWDGSRSRRVNGLMPRENFDDDASQWERDQSASRSTWRTTDRARPSLLLERNHPPIG
jgi:hypothetical protein